MAGCSYYSTKVVLRAHLFFCSIFGMSLCLSKRFLVLLFGYGIVVSLLFAGLMTWWLPVYWSTAFATGFFCASIAILFFDGAERAVVAVLLMFVFVFLSLFFPQLWTMHGYVSVLHLYSIFSKLSVVFLPLSFGEQVALFWTPFLIGFAIPCLLVRYFQKWYLTWKKVVMIFIVLVVFLSGTPHIFEKTIHIVEKDPPIVTRDRFLYLKTFYAMQNHDAPYIYAMGYAFSRYSVGLGLSEHALPKATTWRMPFVFYTWNFLFDNGRELTFGFFLWCAFILLFFYIIGLRFLPPELAVIAPFLLIPFILFTAALLIFLMTEWWALLPFVIGLVFLVYKRYSLAVIFFTVAVISRELFVIHVFSLLCVALLIRKFRLALLLLIPLFGFLVVFVFHYFSLLDFYDISLVQHMMGYIQAAYVPSEITNVSSHGILKGAMKTYNWFYWYGGFTFWIFFAASSVSLVWLVIKKKFNHLFLITAMALIVALSFYWLGPPVKPFQAQTYWNVVFVPFLFLGITGLLQAIMDMKKS